MVINGLEKLPLSLLCIVLFLSWSDPIESEDTAIPKTCNLENTAFQSGEQLVYKIYYNWNFVWLPAGEVIMQAKEEDGVYKLGAYGSTYKTYEWFYKLKYDYECEIDTSTLLPKTALRSVNEKKYKLYDKVDFNHERRKVISQRGKTKAQTRRRTFLLKSCTHDLLSLIYFTRNIDLKEIDIGQEETFNVFLDKKVWSLKARYESRDSMKKIKKLGHFDALHFSSEVMEGKVFKKESKMQVWISNDLNRIPLLIEAPLSAGSVKVILKEHQGLRYNLDAKLEPSKK